MSSPAQPGPSSVSPALLALRQTLDAVDDALLAQLVRRASVVGQIRELGDKGPVKLRPGREAAILNRLLAQDLGNLPARSVVRIWRELFASSLAMQGEFSLKIGGAALLPAAREHFGALTQMQVLDPAVLLAELAIGQTTIGLLPMPEQGSRWWHSAPFSGGAVHVVARLPFWADRPAGSDMQDALVVSTQPPDPSGDDRSLILLDGQQTPNIADAVLIDLDGETLADIPGFHAISPIAGPIAGKVIGCYARPKSDQA